MAEEIRLTAPQLIALKSLTVAHVEGEPTPAVSPIALRELHSLGLAKRRFVRSSGNFGHERALFSITPGGWAHLRSLKQLRSRG